MDLKDSLGEKGLVTLLSDSRGNIERFSERQHLGKVQGADGSVVLAGLVDELEDELVPRDFGAQQRLLRGALVGQLDRALDERLLLDGGGRRGIAQRQPERHDGGRRRRIRKRRRARGGLQAHQVGP